MSTPTNNLTISASDIAQLAGVGRSTVSNWRARHEDFPEPVAGSAASPRFDAAAIREWLTTYGKEVKGLSADRTLWSAMDAWRGAASPEELGSYTGALLTWRYVSDPDSPGFDGALPPETRWPHLRKDANMHDAHDVIDRMHRGMDAYQVAHPERAPLFESFTRGRGGTLRHEVERRPERLFRFLDALSSFEASRIGDVFVSFQDHLTTSARRGYDDFATSATLVELMTAAAKSVPGSVHDPAAGSGRLLVSVGSQGEDRVALTGQDISVDACVQANQRALVTGRDNVTVRVGDIFETDHFGQGLAQVVAIDPPYGISSHHYERLALDPRLRYGLPPKSSMDVAWLQLALWYLGPQGRAFVLQPPRTAYVSGAAGKVRTAMLKDDTVEAIVALPPGLASQTKIPLHLWVLAREKKVSNRGRVLLIDHSNTKDIDADAIAQALQDWRERTIVPTNFTAGAFTVAELLANEGDLTPQRWIASDEGAPDVEKVRGHVEALHRAAAEAKPLDKLTGASLTTGQQAPKLVTVSDLIKAGSLTWLKTRERLRGVTSSAKGTPVVTGGWISRAEKGEPQWINLSLLEHDPIITQPGDILVRITGDLAARVDAEGGRVLLSSSFQLLRVAGEVVRPEYLAEFLESNGNRKLAVGATIQRIRVQDMKIPLLPLEEQDRVLQRIAEIRRLQDAARAILQAADATREDLVEGIAAGTIKIA